MYSNRENGYLSQFADYTDSEYENNSTEAFESVLTEDKVDNNVSLSEEKRDFVGTFEKIEKAEVSKEKKSEYSDKKEKYALSGTGKVLIAVYAFLIIAIFAFIIFNANYLKGLDKKIEATQTEVNQMEKAVSEKKLELDVAKSPETIIQKAIEMGMIPA